MSNCYDWGKIIKNSIKKFITWYFRKEVVSQKVTNKMVATSLKVQYRSSHFWILWKTLSLDFWPKAKNNFRIGELIQLSKKNKEKLI